MIKVHIEFLVRVQVYHSSSMLLVSDPVVYLVIILSIERQLLYVVGRIFLRWVINLKITVLRAVLVLIDQET